MSETQQQLALPEIDPNSNSPLLWLSQTLSSSQANTQEPRPRSNVPPVEIAAIASTSNAKGFHCAICLDYDQFDDLAVVEPCHHQFCREGLRGYILNKLAENRFPVLCPVCLLDTNNGSPSAVSRQLVEQVGISEEQYASWQKLELAAVSVHIECPKCKATFLVDRDDYRNTQVISCPQQDCDGQWCKRCSHEVDNTTEHTCDGTAELNALMQTQRWKRCPGCDTPCSRDTGCNHMSCSVTGCNTHFCYVCGAEITRSTVPDEINTTVQQHYDHCRLFDTDDSDTDSESDDDDRVGWAPIGFLHVDSDSSESDDSDHFPHDSDDESDSEPGFPGPVPGGFPDSSDSDDEEMEEAEGVVDSNSHRLLDGTSQLPDAEEQPHHQQFSDSDDDEEQRFAPGHYPPTDSDQEQGTDSDQEDFTGPYDSGSEASHEPSDEAEPEIEQELDTDYDEPDTSPEDMDDGPDGSDGEPDSGGDDYDDYYDYDSD